MRWFLCVLFLVALAKTAHGAKASQPPVFHCGVGPNVNLSNTDVIIRANIFSPGYLNGIYPPNASCSWAFDIPANKSLVITVINFNVTRNRSWSCGGDSLYFDVNGEVKTDEKCGYAKNKVLKIMHRKEPWNLTAIFKSNGTVESEGFHLTFHVDDEVKAQQPVAAPPLSRPFNCGVNPSVKNRIVGGSEVVPHSIPWQVALINRRYNKKRRICAGTLLSPYHVLTAAHCVQGSNVSQLTIVANEHNDTDDADGTLHNVSCKQDHPMYGNIGIDYDFSILILENPVNISAGTKAKAACLPFFKDEDYVGETLTVSGWGNLKYRGSSPGVLHSADVPGLRNDDCTLYYGFSTGFSLITDRMLCAGYIKKGGISACHGDSGGPISHTVNGVTSVVGVVSWGVGCAGAGRPAVYARVTSVLPWIKGFNITDSGPDVCSKLKA